MIEGVILIGVGRNLNRAIRTCYSFGVYDIYCLNCTDKLTGNLFSADNKVRIHNINSLEMFNINEILGFESNQKLESLQKQSLTNIKYIAVGGESTTLTKKDFPNMVNIKTPNKLCLTTEAALSIALYYTSVNQQGDTS